ncbi:MAG: PQQ-binding-like beta-propeller repeat protein [Planctomycetota bacterium]|nr:PQQ-binding-like beta-propeller repeat protein [Planctomycetota bacterium]
MRSSRLLEAALIPMLLLFACPLAAQEEEGEGEKPPKPEKAEGPEHDVTVSEEEEVKRLLKKAHKAQEDQDWPTCVKAYTDILQKFPASVYLSKWDTDPKGVNRDEDPWGLGVYRSTAERVNEDLAGLPPAGRAVYRAVSDPAAQSLLVEAESRLDERQMERVAQTYFTTSHGDNALQWLGELAYDRGAHRQALIRLAQIEKHPEADVSKASVLARIFLAQLGAGLAEQAKGTLAALGEALKDPKNGALRIGHKEGAEALTDLEARLKALPEAPAQARIAEDDAIETYYGNAAHNRAVSAKSGVGVLKWSEPIVRLLGAPEGTKPESFTTVRTYQGQTFQVRRLEANIVARGGWFFLCGQQVVACHSINNPNLDRPQFLYPPQGQAGVNEPAAQQINQLVEQSLFCSLGGDHLFVVQGPPPPTIFPQNWGGNNQALRPNWIVAVGRKKGGTLGVESGSLLWTLEPGTDPEFRINSKDDQEWLKNVYFASSPTFYDGSLYVVACAGTGGTREAWGACLDAGTGRLLWKTMIASAAPAYFNGALQPELSLPVAVQGGTVYCVTNLGAVAALDAATGQVRWIRIYDRVESGNNMRGMQAAAANDFWGPNPPILYDDLLIVTPQDSPYMYGLDPQTGRRVWQTERSSQAGLGAPGDGEDLKHILGIANGRLVISGKDILFVEAKGGRREVRVPLRDTFEIIGRGCCTQDDVFVSTDQGLLRVNAKLHPKSGKPIGKLVAQHKWKDASKEGNTEAGNLFIVGDVLFSVSATHVNAYFVLEEVEKKILARIEAEPANLANYMELGDVRLRAEAYPQAIEAFDKGLALAEAQGADPKAKGALADFRSRKFEAYYAAGEKLMAQGQPDGKTAFEMYEAALKNGVQPDQPVRALWKMAEARLLLKEEAAAAQLFHRLLIEHGDVVHGFGASGTKKAAVFAQARLAKLKEGNPQAVAELERLAREALDAALKAEGPAGLELVVRHFPTSDALGDALLALAERKLAAGQANEARMTYRRYLVTFREGPRGAEALARLSQAYEMTGMLSAAKSTLRKLTRAPWNERELNLGGAARKAGAWAEARLQEPAFLKPATAAPRELGSGKLKELWSVQAGNNLVALDPRGRAPAEQLRNVWFIENGKSLVARGGADGQPLWKTPQEAPPGYNRARGFAFWSDRLLILAGKQELAAFDTAQEGKPAWRFKLAPNPETGGGDLIAMNVADQRVVLAQQGGQVTVLEAQTGDEMWRLALPGAGPFLDPPAVGDGFVALGRANEKPAQLLVLDLETGLKRFDLKLGDRLTDPPRAVGESIYAASADKKVSAFDAHGGKLLWTYALDNVSEHLFANDDLVAAVVKGNTVVVLDPQAADDKRLRWRSTDFNGAFAGLLVDGEDVLLATRGDAQRGQVVAFKAVGGKLRWIQETAGTPVEAHEALARGHLLIRQSTFDPKARAVSGAGLVDRETGKLTWVADLGSSRNFALALFDGGVMVGDGRELKGYLAVDAERSQQKLEELKARVAKDPKDARTSIEYAQLLYQTGKGPEALQALAGVLAFEGLDEATFGEAFLRFSQYRKETAQKQKDTLTFARIQAPTIDGKLEDWKNVPAQSLDSWRHVILPGEEDRREPLKPDAWKGAGDLSVTFQGGYDEKNLYLAFVVRDDVHANPRDGGNCWNGDSLQLAFDMEQEEVSRHRGDDFELGFALNDKGQLQKWRWVERSFYVMKALEADPKVLEAQAKEQIGFEKALEGLQAQVARDEAGKRTVYELALPLAYLNLKSEPGRKFGFTFVANDLDQGENLERGMGPSPGIWNPKFPCLYAQGQLAEKP